MNKISVQKLTRVVRVLIIALFVINILALLLLPGLFYFAYDHQAGQLQGVPEGIRDFIALWNYEWDDALANLVQAPWWIISRASAKVVSLMLFLWACGICSAVLLWQAKRVVDTIIAENTFSFVNAANMMRACFCCFGISAAALIRLIWSMVYYHSAMPIFSYNTLFIAVFAVAGLICIVLSAVFRQAAEMKAENDLTI